MHIPVNSTTLERCPQENQGCSGQCKRWPGSLPGALQRTGQLLHLKQQFFLMSWHISKKGNCWTSACLAEGRGLRNNQYLTISVTYSGLSLQYASWEMLWFKAFVFIQLIQWYPVPFKLQYFTICLIAKRAGPHLGKEFPPPSLP